MDILKIVADNQALTDALKVVILKQFDLSTISISKAPEASDELIGQWVRAQIRGLQAVEEAFREIAQYKTVEGRTETHNRAR